MELKMPQTFLILDVILNNFICIKVLPKCMAVCLETMKYLLDAIMNFQTMFLLEEREVLEIMKRLEFDQEERPSAEILVTSRGRNMASGLSLEGL